MLFMYSLAGTFWEALMMLAFVFTADLFIALKPNEILGLLSWKVDKDLVFKINADFS